MPKVVDVVEVQPEFELVTNIALSLGKRDFSVVFQMKFFLVLAALASTVGEVRRKKGETNSASDGNLISCAYIKVLTSDYIRLSYSISGSIVWHI